MLDFYNGWNMPRHLYRSDLYKIWGKFPYEKGDYQIDALFRMIWPGYEDCSYLRNERGFLTPTPYGDSFDVITNRCHQELLNQYPAIMLLGDVELTPDVVQRLTGFVRQGGDLLLDANHARALSELCSGVRLGENQTGYVSCVLASGETFDEQPYTYTLAELLEADPLLTNELGKPLLTVQRVGRGRVVVCTVDHWLTEGLKYRAPELMHLAPPYQLLRGVRAVLAEYFSSFSPVQVHPAGLGVTVCCFAEDAKRLLVGLMNQDLFADWQGTLQIRLGPIKAVRELLREQDLPAQVPLPLAIPAGETLILDVRL